MAVKPPFRPAGREGLGESGGYNVEEFKRKENQSTKRIQANQC